MTRKSGARARPSPVPGLRARLEEAEATLAAIRTGQVDALVVTGPGGDRTLAIEGATHPYFVLLNAMSDGAALLVPDGTILFANRRLAEIVHTPLEALQGTPFQRVIAPGEVDAFEALMQQGAVSSGVGEFGIPGPDEVTTPVRIALSRVALGPGEATVVMAMVADLTDRKHAEATRLDLMKQLINAEDEERRRIARELHDETGQSLTALLVGLLAIEVQAGSDEVRSAAQQLRVVASTTVENVGRLARGLHPSALDDLGLVAAAGRYVSDYTKAHQARVDFTVGVLSRQLPRLVQTTIYRILQEALTNVARHAQAQVVGVDLRHSGDMLELVVRDDGRGFDPVAVRGRGTSLGLHGMRERVALLGGSIGFESKPGQGTVIRVRVPAAPPRNRDPALA